jgi:hypothetical protein
MPVLRRHGFSLKAMARGADPEVLTYAIWDGEAVKVGKVTNKHPSQRLADLQTGSSQPLRLLAYTATTTEAAAHRKLYKAHLRGEWFRTEAVLDLVRDWDWLDCELFDQLRELCSASQRG